MDNKVKEYLLRHAWLHKCVAGVTCSSQQVPVPSSKLLYEIPSEVFINACLMSGADGSKGVAPL